MMKKYAILFCTVILCISCHDRTKKQKPKQFFSLKHFFEQEEIRLSKTKKDIHITKSVLHNGQFERKNIIIQNWKNELSTFIESDINKPAWRDSYRTLGDSTHIYYYALDSNLRTRSIHVQKNIAGIVRIDIINKTSNLLYQSHEHLIYIPDSIYTIRKNQHVILLGNNSYLISGKFGYSLPSIRP